MSRFGTGDLFLADCPGRLTVELIADKWTAVVLYGLSEGPVRHGELGRAGRQHLAQGAHPDAAAARVARTLRRQAYAEAPPRVEYETLIEPIHILTEWARENSEAVLEALDGDD